MMKGSETSGPKTGIPFRETSGRDILDDRYRLIERIGHSDVGQLFLAHDPRLRRKVVIKQLHTGTAAGRSLRPKFRGAAELMASLQHPNVVTVHDAGGWETQPYLVMPLCEGTRLDHWATRHDGPNQPLEVILGILDQACAGVSAMHEVGLIHGNIKPSRILLSDALEVVLVDLAMCHCMKALQAVHDPAKTLGFEAPELIRRDDIGPLMAPKLDVYSLGVIAYWMLTGQSPWGKDTDTLVRQLDPDITPPSQARPDLPGPFDRPILQALHSDPVQRPSIDEFREGLSSAMQESSQQSPPFIVVVDDDQVSLMLAEEAARAAVDNAEVVGVPDPQSALAIIGIRRPDLVVTDLNMPQLNGIEFTAALRGNSSTESVPVIVVTGVGGADDWKLLHALGAEHLMIKPIRPMMLRDAIRRLLKLDSEQK